MEVSVSKFRVCYPEFRDTSEELCRQKLAEAALQVSETFFSDKTEAGIMLLAADLLSTSPMGEQAKLRLENRGTIYGERFKEMCYQVTMGAGRVA